MPDQFGVARPPIWRPLRRGLYVVDSGGAVLNPFALPLQGGSPQAMQGKGIGLEGEGYRWGLFRFRVVSGTIAGQTISLRPYFWDEGALTDGRFVVDSMIVSVSFAQTSYHLPYSTYRFNLYGRMFTVGLLSNAGNLVLDIDGAVFGGSESHGLFID